MNASEETRAVVEACARGSHDGTLDFPAVVARLTAADVESYHADYRRAETTYYLAGGATHVVALPSPPVPVADAFAADAVRDAVLGSQRGEVRYPGFLRLTRAAGCVGYIVWIAGRRVQYFGRRGEVHTEHFPDAR
ncbi:MAG TPA: DUF1398 family protein [Longimicrobium sp.]|nr:DUF1398 family protein [Longimicrobium sp.]